MRDELGGLLAFTDALAKFAVAAPGAVTRRHQITETAQAVKRLGSGTERRTDAHHLGERARKQRGVGVVAKPEARRATRGDGINIF